MNMMHLFAYAASHCPLICSLFCDTRFVLSLNISFSGFILICFIGVLPCEPSLSSSSNSIFLPASNAEQQWCLDRFKYERYTAPDTDGEYSICPSAKSALSGRSSSGLDSLHISVVLPTASDACQSRLFHRFSLSVLVLWQELRPW
ncbi:hypothetical protein DM02DRAFT_116100 [Periconia macrospinosa]|uniref:Uncharacterized protein n=1 Tax=Periconia macrospinosa TaxID=97972 RepID=A0A2V1DEL6_9PLEO|nr:hypothetical protein DM02DRAFT_116100 [Periconia macrospinosa]